jgi:uncharacterized protein with gpF-like domain
MADSSPFIPIAISAFTGYAIAIWYAIRKIFHLKVKVDLKPSVEDMEKKIKESEKRQDKNFKGDFLLLVKEIEKTNESTGKISEDVKDLKEDQKETGKIVFDMNTKISEIHGALNVGKK